MLFNVEEDHGHRITGYLVPDSFSGIGRVQLRAGGQVVLEMSTGEVRPSLVIAGRHESGLCGFSIDETMVPGLASLDSVEIVDAESGVLVYRRSPKTECLSKRLVRLETHLHPISGLDVQLAPHFKYAYTQAERFGLESSTQMFLINNSESIYIAGRLLYRNIEQYLEQGFHVCCVLHDPFEELAERLLLLRQIARNQAPQLDQRDSITFESAMSFANSLDFREEKQLRKLFGDITYECAAALSNPLLRQLTARNAGEIPTSRFVSSALYILSTFAVVAPRASCDTFTSTVGCLIGAEGQSFSPIRRSRSASRLAELLRKIPVVTDLLELDLDVYSCMLDAFDKSFKLNS